MVAGQARRIQASARTPCPVCGRLKSCSWEAGGLLFCMGIGEAAPPDGWAFVDRGQFDKHGFRHLKRDDGREEPRGRADPPPFANKGGKLITPEQRQQLAEHLGLPAEVLKALPVGWDGSAWTWPERDGGGNVVGIARRFPDGSKKQVAGGARGLTVFAGWRDRPGPLFVCEGMSDGLAVTSAGLAAVGRANATAGSDDLPDLLRDWPAGRGIVFLADNDDAGTAGARVVACDLAAALDRPIRVAVPPDGAKDAREYLTAERWGETPWPERGSALLRHVEATAEEVTARPSPESPTAGNPAPPKKAEWPAPPAEDAYHGLAGDIVRFLEPHTEADPVALLVQLLTMFGNVVGRNAHFLVEGTPHFTNLFAALVGSTSNGRKGTAHGRVKPLFQPLDEDWLLHRSMGGVSSSEGLLYQVRDANEKLEDEGEPDKRLMLTEPEFANVLKQGERQGNTVSVYLRELWDGLPVVQTLTKTAPVKATEAHVSLIGHTTPEELARCLTATETANGFANRFLFVCVRRSKFLPFGGDALNRSALADLQHRLDAAAGFAQTAGRIDWHPSARPLWAAVYPTLTGERNGLAGAMTARAAPITLRLAMLYALLDRSPAIRPRHLMAALAVWDSAERSVNFLFGDKTGNPLADELRELLRNAPAGLTRSDLNKAMGNHAYGEKLTTALLALQSAGLANKEQAKTGGRPSERWHATGKEAVVSPLMRVAREAFAACVECVESLGHVPTPFQRFERIPRTAGEDTDRTLPGASPPPPPHEPQPAEVWLVNQLRRGPKPVNRIEAEVRAAGLHVTTVRTVTQKVLGIVPFESRPGRWEWALPDYFDFTPYPPPPEPEPPTLVDDLRAPEQPAKPKTETKRAKSKRGADKKRESAVSATNPTAGIMTPTAEDVERLLRRQKRAWADVAAFLDERGEYYPADLEIRGLTGPQLNQVADWLATA